MGANTRGRALPNLPLLQEEGCGEGSPSQAPEYCILGCHGDFSFVGDVPLHPHPRLIEPMGGGVPSAFQGKPCPRPSLEKPLEGWTQRTSGMIHTRSPTNRGGGVSTRG